MRENAVGQVAVGECDFVRLLIEGAGGGAFPLVADGDWADLFRDSCAAGRPAGSRRLAG